MPYDNHYSNGNFRFLNKTIPNDILPVSLPSNIIKVGKGDYIQSDIVGVSYKIIDSNHDTIAHFMIMETVGWTIQGSQISLASADHIIYYLLFSSEAEATIADLRLYKIMEGGSIINPGDENL